MNPTIQKYIYVPHFQDPTKIANAFFSKNIRIINQILVIGKSQSEQTLKKPQVTSKSDESSQTYPQ